MSMTNQPEFQKGTKVVSRDGQHVGELTGGSRACRLAGCTGVKLGVRWEDKRVTFPCSKGLEQRGVALHLV